MRLIHFILFLTGSFATMALAIGLYRPWIALWWQETQSRRKVIKIYGSIALVCILLSSIMRMINVLS